MARTNQNRYSLHAYHEALGHTSHRIGETLFSISGHSLNEATSDQLIRSTKIEEQLVTLENTMHRLTTRAG